MVVKNLQIAGISSSDQLESSHEEHNLSKAYSYPWGFYDPYKHT